MLPDFLSDSYSRYKDDTNVFATWLTNTAQSCGYKPVPQHVATSSERKGPASTRLKGSARKEAKAKESYRPLGLAANKQVISTGEVIVQAELIASFEKPEVKVPLAIQGALRRAIRTRKECALYFQRIAEESRTDEYALSNASHKYFVEVLERALQILEPRFETSTHTTSEVKPRQETVPPSSLNNLFENLTVEDTTDEYHDINVTDATSSKGIGKQPKNTDVTVFEFERSIEEELQFRVFCFFEDLHRAQDFLAETWQLFADDQIDLPTASLVTNVTFALIQQSEEETKKLSPQLDTDDSYKSIVSVINPILATANNVEALKAMHQSPPLDAFVFGSTFVSMFKTISIWSNKQEDLKGEAPSSIIPVSRLYNVAGLWAPKDKDLVADDHFLTQFLLDMIDVISIGLHSDRTKEAQQAGQLKRRSKAIHSSAFVDELTQGLKEALLTGCITVANVFQARLLLNIQKILGDQVEQPYKELRQKGASNAAAIGLKWKLKDLMQRSLPEGNDQEWIRDWGSGKIFDAAKVASYSILADIEHNPLVVSKQQRLSLRPSDGECSVFSAKGALSFLCKLLVILTGWKDITPSPDPAFLHNHNPIYCGLEELKMLVAMENVGVKLSNHLCSLVPVAHLYNALRQTQLLTESWPAMDQAIETNLSLFFHGSEPVKVDQIISRYMVCMKWPVTAVARNGRRQSSNWKAISKKLDTLHALEESSKYLQAYLEGTGTAEKFLYDILKQSKCSASTFKTNHGLTRLEMLHRLRDILPKIVTKLMVDQVTLPRQCNKLLQLIRAAFKTRLGIENMHKDMEIGEAFEKWNVNTVMMIFAEAFPPQNSGQQTPLHELGGASQLSIAAEITNNFIQEVSAAAPIEPFDVVAAANRYISEDFQIPASIRRLMERWGMESTGN